MHAYVGNTIWIRTNPWLKKLFMVTMDCIKILVVLPKLERLTKKKSCSSPKKTIFHITKGKHSQIAFHEILHLKKNSYHLKKI